MLPLWSVQRPLEAIFLEATRKVMIQWTEFTLSDRETSVAWMQATLINRGLISLNRAAFRAMGQPKAVTLLFDQMNHLIGLRPAGALAKNAIPLVQRKDSGGSYRLRAKKFCNYYQISTDHAMVFKNIQRLDDGTLILPLKEAAELRGKADPVPSPFYPIESQK